MGPIIQIMCVCVCKIVWSVFFFNFFFEPKESFRLILFVHVVLWSDLWIALLLFGCHVFFAPVDCSGKNIDWGVGMGAPQQQQ